MSFRKNTNLHPNKDMSAIILVTHFMRENGDDLISRTWDGDQSEHAITCAIHHQERTLGLTFNEARDVVINTILGPKGPAAILPEAALFAEQKSLKIDALTV